MANRRSILIGLGSLVAGGGALLGTGAFTTVTAERTVNVETAGDASAFLGLAPAARNGTPENPFVDQTDETVTITLENDDSDGTGANATGINENARTTFRNLVTVTNNGTQPVNTLNLEFTSGPISSLDATFQFTASSDSADSNEATDISNGSDILSTSADDSNTLTPGESINFGIIIDLLDGGNGDNSLPDDGNYTLQITAETSNSA